jgi:hypothetical protein
MGEREFEVLGDQLLDIWSLDIIGACELNHLQDLMKGSDVSARLDL